MDLDKKYIKECFKLAKKGALNVLPNPLVGCVVVKNGKIISKGYHKKYGEFHAERNALLNLEDDMAQGAVSSLKNHGYNGEGQTVIPVFGVDAMDFAVALINEGSMTGTVKQDAVGMADADKTIAVNFINGASAFDGINAAYELVGSWRVNIPYSAYNG